MSQTTEDMKDAARTIARLITEQGKTIGVDECIVDDWGRFGNFSLLCYLDVNHDHSNHYKPNNKNTLSLVKIVYLIKRIIKQHEKQGARLRSHECPQGIYSSQKVRGRTVATYFEGYDKRYIFIDLDFIPYNAGTNTFATQEFVGSDDPQQLSLNL